MAIVICDNCNRPMVLIKTGVVINASVQKNEIGDYRAKQVGTRYKCPDCNVSIITQFGDVTHMDSRPVEVEVSGGIWGNAKVVLHKNASREFLTHQPFFNDVKSGRKTFDIRLGDKEVEDGDIISFVEYEPIQQRRGEVVTRKVSMVVRTDDLDYWSHVDIEEHGYVVIGLEPDLSVALNIAKGLYDTCSLHGSGSISKMTILRLVEVLGGEI